MTTEVEVKIRRVGKFIGGPYDGAEIRGWSIPDTVIVDDQATRFIGTPTGGVKFIQTKANGRYTAGDEYVNLYGQPIDYCYLLSTDPRLIEDAESEVYDDETRCAIVFVNYKWTHQTNQPCDPRDA